MKSLRIAAGLGFYGDSWQPIKASIERGNVQYVCSDHLAELTLAILQKNRQRDSTLGYTQDLVPMLSDLLPLAIRHGARFVLNAGGLNPLAAREALLAVLRKLGLKLKVGVVLGDAVIERIDDSHAGGPALSGHCRRPSARMQRPGQRRQLWWRLALHPRPGACRLSHRRGVGKWRRRYQQSAGDGRARQL